MVLEGQEGGLEDCGEPCEEPVRAQARAGDERERGAPGAEE